MIEIDKGVLAPEDYENTKLITLDDGTQKEVYISRAGNVVTHPLNRSTGLAYDPRQEICWEAYVKSVKLGAPNARQAAREAGYSENTAINIGNMAWFKEKKDKLRRSKMMSKAERNLSRILDLDYSKMKLMDDGSEEQVVDKDVLRVVADVSKTIVTTLGKDLGYSTKTEIKGDMSGEIKINSISYADNPIEIEAHVVDNAIETMQQEILKEVIKEE